MALSGSFSGSIVSEHYKVRVDWTASQDVTNNRTTITCKLYFINDWNINIGARTNTVTIAGTSYSLSSSATSTKGTHYIGSCSKTIDHNPDGSLGNVNISAVFNIKATIDGTYYASISAAATVWIDTIPRASQPSCITWPENTQNVGNIGSTISIHMNRKGNFTHYVYCKWHNKTVEIGQNVADGVRWTIPLDFIDDIPNSLSSWGTIYVDTYSGTTCIGTKSVRFDATVPDTDVTKPTATMDISPSNIGEWVTTDYVQGMSQVIATMTASAQFKANIKSYNVTVDGKTTTESTGNITTQVLNNSGTFTVVGKSIDTRNIASIEIKKDITVIPYGKPYITHNSSRSNIVCARYDEEKEDFADNGTSIKLIFGAKWYSLSNKENTATVQVRCVSSNTDSGWIPIEAVAQGGGEENKYISYYDIDVVVPGVTVAVDKTYQVYIRCVDNFGNYNSDSDLPYKIPTEDVCLHLGEKGNKAAFGKYSERDKTLEVASDWDLMLKNQILNDFVIETDTVGIWTYEKWASGKAVCWGVTESETFNMITSYGNVYYSSASNGDKMGTAAFPSELFVAPPTSINVQNYATQGLIGCHICGVTKDGFEFFVSNPGQLTLELRFTVEAKGRWK